MVYGNSHLGNYKCRSRSYRKIERLSVWEHREKHSFVGPATEAVGFSIQIVAPRWKMDDVIWVKEFLKGKTPRAERFAIREPLAGDEAQWFRRGIDAGLFIFCTCGPQCARFRRWHESGPDEFKAASGKSGARHLFSLSRPARLNREYIPHMAALGRLVLREGYDQNRSSFSLHRKFKRNLCLKREGQSYESDVEFYDYSGAVWLQVEAKKSQREITKISQAIEGVANGLLGVDGVPKELEYVLDLRPKYLWLVAPGLIDPARHIYEVAFDNMKTTFSLQEDLPHPAP